MRSVILAVIAAIKRRKIYSAVIVSCLFLASLLSMTTLGMMLSVQEPFDRFFEKMKGSHLLLFSESNLNQLDSIGSWFEDQEEIDALTPNIPYILVDKPIVSDQREIDMMVHLVEHHPVHLKRDMVYIREGKNQKHPEIGEIWITENMAKDFHIKIGDSLSIPIANGSISLTVAAIVLDPHYASGLFNPTRAWIASGALSFYLPIRELRTSLIAVRFKSLSHVGEVVRRFNDKWVFEGKALQYEQFKSAYLSFFNILKMILVIFSVLALIGALLIIYLSLIRSIASNRRMIGNFKAIGFSPFNIMQYYAIHYLVLLAFAIIPAAICAYAILHVILSSIGGAVVIVDSISTYIILAATITLTLFSIVLIIVAIVGSYRISREKPSNLINKDSATSYSNVKLLRKWLHFSNIPVPVFLGINWVFSNARRSIYTGFAMLLAIFILVFSVNVSNSFSKLKDNREAWGIDNTDVLIKLNQEIAIPLQKEQLETHLNDNEAVDFVMPYSYLTAILPLESKANSLEIQGKVYFDNISMSGLKNLSGIHPERPDEISLCMLSARELDKNIGDSITLVIEGQSKVFSLTGIYQDVNNLGRGFRIREDAIKVLNPFYTPGLYSVKLKSSINKEEFKSQLAIDFGETLLIETNIEDRTAIQGVISSMHVSLAIFSFFFIAVMILFLFNDIVSHLHDNKKSFGILKSIGFSPGMVNLAALVRILFLTFLCTIIGIPISIYIVPGLVNNITQGIGLQEFPYVKTMTGNVMIAVGMLVIALLSNMIISRSILKINSRELVTN